MSAITDQISGILLKRAVAFAFLVISLGSLNTAFAVPESADPIAEPYEQFLVDLYAGMKQRRLVQGDDAAKSFAWSHTALTDLKSALQSMNSGGFVTPSATYSQEATLVVIPTQSGFTLQFSEAALPLSEGLIARIYEPYFCRVLRFNAGESPRLGEIAQSLRCLFATTVRREHIPAPPTIEPFELQTILAGSTPTVLRDYLSELVSLNILEFAELQLEKSQVLLKLPGAYEGPVSLDLSRVSPYPDVQSEADSLARDLKASSANQLFWARDGLFLTLEAEELLQALEVGIDSASEDSDELRREVLHSLGVEVQTAPAAQPAQPAQPARPCTYTAGVVTPCNREVADFYGIDHNGAIGPRRIFPKLKTALSSFGYTFKTVNASSPIFGSRFNETTEFAKLRSAETIIINAHGDSAGRFGMQCYVDIPLVDSTGRRISQACCLRLKRTAEALGLPGASTINCNGPDRPFQDPSGSLVIESSSWCSGPWGDDERCQIVATPAFFNNLGTKAAIFTGQCSGGRCAPLAGGTNAMDFFSASILLNYSGRYSPSGFDDALLANDLLGEANYCITGTPSAPGRNFPEPFGGERFEFQCIGRFARLYPGSPSMLRTIQSSRAIRGASGQYAGSIADCRYNYGGGGFQQYCVAAPVGGAPATLVEFAPTVDLVNFDEPSGTLVIATTSRLDPRECSIEVTLEGDASPSLSTIQPFVAKSCSATGAGIVLSRDPGILSSAEWAGDPQALRDFYGKDQTNWPWFIKVVVRAKAPNGISMIGNDSAFSKWIWASPQTPPIVQVTPYRAGLGIQDSGGTTFELRIPVAPPTTCCMPNIEWRGLPPSPSQNGCLCAGQVGRNACFVGTCLTGNIIDGFSNVTLPGLRPDQCQGSYQRFDGRWQYNYDCCPVYVNGSERCPAMSIEVFPEPPQCIPGDEYLQSRAASNYIGRPWDRGQILQCPAIDYLGMCADH